MDYTVRYNRKRLFKKFLKKTDVYEVWGPVKHYFADQTYGNGGESDIITRYQKIETFTDKEEAEAVAIKYNKG